MVYAQKKKRLRQKQDAWPRMLIHRALGLPVVLFVSLFNFPE